MIDILDIVRDDPNINAVLVQCESGFHRADTCGRTIEAGLNAVFNESNNRVYNAMLFSACEQMGNKGLYKMVDRAVDWSTGAWLDTPTTDGGCEDSTRRYAFEGVKVCSTAYDNFVRFWAHVDYVHCHVPIEVPDVGTHDNHDNDDDDKYVTVKAEETGGTKRKRATPRQPSTLPPNARASTTVDYMIDADWSDILDEFDIDTTARRSLKLLAASGDVGRKEGALILTKLINKRAVGDPMTNPSKFVHKCTCNARTKISNQDIKALKSTRDDDDDDDDDNEMRHIKKRQDWAPKPKKQKVKGWLDPDDDDDDKTDWHAKKSSSSSSWSYDSKWSSGDGWKSTGHWKWCEDEPASSSRSW